MINLLINLLAGMFFLIGALIAIKLKNNKRLTSFSIGMAFIVLIILLLTDILPETLELFTDYKWMSIGGGILVGWSILYLLEKLVPHHDHFEEKEHHHHTNHLNHIGIMTSLALIIHNLIEGISIYGVASSDQKTGFLYALAVGMHNIPFGIEITAMLDQKKNKKVMWTYIILLTLSTFIGGLFLFIFNYSLSNFLLGSLLSITMGMIIYLIFFELLIELKESFNKYSIYGILIGILLMLVGMNI